MKKNNIYKIVLFLLLILVIQASAVELVVSTETDNVYLDHETPEVNISIIEPNLDSFKFNWNGTNYSFYDSNFVLSMNFDNIAAIGEKGTGVVDISKYGNNGTMHNMNIGVNNCSRGCSGWNTSGKYGNGIGGIQIVPK